MFTFDRPIKDLLQARQPA